MKNTTILVLLLAVIFSRHAALAQAKPSANVSSVKPTIIHYEIDLKGSPQKVYEALLSAKLFTEITGAPAEIDPVAGGAFSLFDKHIVGRNIELVPGQRIVQAWRAGDWPAGVYSIAKFELTQQGRGTRIIFDHTAFPEGLADHLAAGWQSHYWDTFTKYFDAIKKP